MTSHSRKVFMDLYMRISSGLCLGVDETKRAVRECKFGVQIVARRTAAEKCPAAPYIGP